LSRGIHAAIMSRKHHGHEKTNARGGNLPRLFKLKESPFPTKELPTRKGEARCSPGEKKRPQELDKVT